MSEAERVLPDCIKCGNKRKIQAGYMERDCICARKEPITRVKSPPHNEVWHKPVPFDTPAVPVKEVSTNVSAVEIEKPTNQTGETITVSPDAAIDIQYAGTATDEPLLESAAMPVERASSQIASSEPTKKPLRKSEVALAVGRNMGYTDRVIEAIMCERETDPLVWAAKYRDIYLDPLATQPPPGYDPTKYIPGDGARDSFRALVNANLPNKKRKVNFDDMVGHLGAESGEGGKAD